MFFVYTDALIVYTFPLHIYTVSSMKQGSDTGGALRNVGLRTKYFKHVFGFVICICYLSKATFKVMLPIGGLWTLIYLSFHECQSKKKERDYIIVTVKKFGFVFFFLV